MYTYPPWLDFWIPTRILICPTFSANNSSIFSTGRFPCSNSNVCATTPAILRRAWTSLSTLGNVSVIVSSSMPMKTNNKFAATSANKRAASTLETINEVLLCACNVGTSAIDCDETDIAALLYDNAILFASCWAVLLRVAMFAYCCR